QKKKTTNTVVDISNLTQSWDVQINLDINTNYLVIDYEKDNDMAQLMSPEQSTKSDSEDDFLQFKDNEIFNYYPKNNAQMSVDNYLSNTSFKTSNDLPLSIKKAYIRFNTTISPSAPVEWLFNEGGQLREKWLIRIL
ncbi:uncharacterized protein LOC126895619, partial [Daktulosphaira vitifoliae]|uniref:uncharacterized protein LOC126895619 n=1 Tax=Daktulosphaira vitifoliae TaxID=58002 RepID=UPI0021AA3A47